MEKAFRNLPSVYKLVLGLGPLGDGLPHEMLVDLARRYLDGARQGLARGEQAPSFEGMVAELADRVRWLTRPSPVPIINATGVILHTNLGRAPLSPEAIAAMEAVSRGYCNLEFDLEAARRGSRQEHVERLLCQLSGAESALVVNNNAAAVLLGLTALARRREVIVSRGQAVEIGGGFRIPDVMRQSGARLVEVGTTNCTYVSDYANAITDKTAVLLRVHTSNFSVVGHTHSVELREMVELGKKANIPVFDDLGSGCFLDTARFGLAAEPTIQESLAAGAALVFCSGDKLIGGPQAGIVLGRKELISKLKRHPLARAIRIDKIRLAGLVATLQHYLKGEAVDRIPIWRMIAAPLEQVAGRAERWAGAVPGMAGVIEGESLVGGGSLPGATLPTRLVAIKGKGSPQRLAQRLRQTSPPVIARVEEDALLLDPRSVLPEEDEAVLAALRNLELL